MLTGYDSWALKPFNKGYDANLTFQSSPELIMLGAGAEYKLAYCGEKAVQYKSASPLESSRKHSMRF